MAPLEFGWDLGYYVEMGYKNVEQQSAYQNRWMKARRKAWLEKNGPCVDCGSFKQLEVHHKDKTQKVTHRVWSWSESRRLAELSKCCALCLRCHQRRTARDRRSHLKHGMYGMYAAGCRCDLCKRANAERVRKQRLKMKAQVAQLAEAQHSEC